jgi:PAS domain S-box-containing protein
VRVALSAMAGRVALDRRSVAGAGAEALRALIDHAPVAMFVKDLDGRYLLANHEFERIFGFPESALLGRDAYDLMPREHADQVRANDAALLTRTAPLRVEETVPRDGTPHVFLSIKFALREPDGEPWATCGVAVDITEERAAREEALRAGEELERSNAELARFAALASHDLSEPLRVIAGFARLLAQRTDLALDDSARGHLEQIVASTTRMQQLIEGMLSIARLQPQALAREPVALDDLLALVVDDLAVAFAERDARVRAEPLPRVWGDPVQLAALLRNLLANALKFTPQDRAPVIDISPQPDPRHWTITVADNGIGIDPRHRAEIFEPFRRLHSHDTYPGTGLGLASCRRIVELHGGRIWAEPNEPVGTRFRFLLPTRTAPRTETAPGVSGRA